MFHKNLIKAVEFLEGFFSTKEEPRFFIQDERNLPSCEEYDGMKKVFHKKVAHLNDYFGEGGYVVLYANSPEAEKEGYPLYMEKVKEYNSPQNKIIECLQTAKEIAKGLSLKVFEVTMYQGDSQSPDKAFVVQENNDTCSIKDRYMMSYHIGKEV